MIHKKNKIPKQSAGRHADAIRIASEETKADQQIIEEKDYIMGPGALSIISWRRAATSDRASASGNFRRREAICS